MTTQVLFCPVHTVCQLTLTEWPHSCPVLSKMFANRMLQNEHTVVPSCPVLPYPTCMSTDCYRVDSHLSCPHCMSTDSYRITTQLSCVVQTVCHLTVTEWPHSCPVLSTLYVTWLLQNDHTTVLYYPDCISTDSYIKTTQKYCPVNTVCQLTVSKWPKRFPSWPHCISTDCYRRNTALVTCLVLSTLYANC